MEAILVGAFGIRKYGFIEDDDIYTGTKAFDSERCKYYRTTRRLMVGRTGVNADIV
jgi:hypothetical protein